MKNYIRYIKHVGIFVLALIVVSCTEFEEYESTTYGAGPTVTLAGVSAQDSTLTVSATSSADGYVSVILLPGTGNTAPEDPEDLATGNVSYMDYQTKRLAANIPINFTFSGLVQDAAYEVMSVATDMNGKYSEVATLAVGTDDTHPPVLVETSPGVGYDPVLPVDGSVVLVFDEPVVYDDTKDLVFSEFYTGNDVVAGSVTVDNNEVTVALGAPVTNREYVMLSYPEGAFTDHSGNPAAAMDSYFDGAGLVGLYWRAVAKDFEPVSITPEEEVVPTGFDIVVTYAEPVNADDVVDGDITLTYDDGTDILIKSVLASEVSAAGNDLTITQSYSAPPGVEVTLTIPADILSVGHGNPNAEVTASWTIQHPLQAWIGTYDVDAASYGDPGNWDEVWTVTTAPVAGDLTSLAITIDAGGGGGVPFNAVINDVAMTITITAGTNAGDIYGYGPTLIYSSDYSTLDEVAPVVGTISANGDIAIDQLGMVLGDYASPTTIDGIWDAFNTTWTKSAKKAAVSGNVPSDKANRFR